MNKSETNVISRPTARSSRKLTIRERSIILLRVVKGGWGQEGIHTMKLSWRVNFRVRTVTRPTQNIAIRNKSPRTTWSNIINAVGIFHPNLNFCLCSAVLILSLQSTVQLNVSWRDVCSTTAWTRITPTLFQLSKCGRFHKFSVSTQSSAVMHEVRLYCKLVKRRLFTKITGGDSEAYRYGFRKRILHLYIYM